MRLIDIVIDIVIDKLNFTPLFEMAYERRKAWDIVSERAYTLSEHILKVLLMPESRDIPHWISEINGNLNLMSAIILKPKGRRLTREDYYKWLIVEPDIVLQLDSIVGRLASEYKRVPRERFQATNVLKATFTHIMNSIVDDLDNNTHSIDNLKKHLNVD